MKVMCHFDKDLTKSDIVLSLHPYHKGLSLNLKNKLSEAFQTVKAYDEQNNMYPIPLISILYLEIVDRKIFAYTKDKQYVVHETSLKKFQAHIESTDFYRISNAIVINKNCIVSKRIIKNKKRLLLLTNGEYLEVSRQYSKMIDKLM